MRSTDLEWEPCARLPHSAEATRTTAFSVSSMVRINRDCGQVWSSWDPWVEMVRNDNPNELLPLVKLATISGPRPSISRFVLRRLLPLVLLATGACDPCTGLGSCAGARIRYEGQLVRGTGPGADPVVAASIPVEFIRTGGVSLDSDTVRTTTDSEGNFILQTGAASSGEVVGELLFHSPEPIPAMRVTYVRMLTTRAPGDLHRLGVWKIRYPYLGYQFFLHYRATNAPAVGLEVTFRRTSGIPITPDPIRVVTDERGYAVLRPFTSVVGEVKGDLTVNLLPPRAPLVLHDLTLRTFQEERYDSVQSVGIGSRLPYSAIVVAASDGHGLADVEVEFERTGGVQIYPEHFVSKTNDFGTVYLNPVPLETGELRGNVIIRPPAPGEEVIIRDLHLPTVEDERTIELLGYWSVPGL